MQQQTPASGTDDTTSHETINKPPEAISELMVEEDSQEVAKIYPMGLKLMLITISLMLAVFCVALDNTVSRPADAWRECERLTWCRYWLLPFPKSPISSGPSTTWAGMRPPIF